MASENPRVALLGLPSELQELLADGLSSEGYSICVLARAPDGVALPPGERPLVIIAAAGLRPESVAVLDALRTRPDTSAIPVIALSSAQAQQVQAQASGNVYASLPMPFELDDLLQALHGALEQTPFEARVQQFPPKADAALSRAADVLAGAEREIMLNWVQRIRQVEPFRSRDDLSTREFLDSVPRILNAVVLTLERQVRAEVLLEDHDARGRIRAHADLRHRQGMPAEAVVREYQVLRQVITDKLRADLPPEERRRVLDEVYELLDSAVRITVAEFTQLLQGGPERGAGFSCSVES